MSPTFINTKPVRSSSESTTATSSTVSSPTSVASRSSTYTEAGSNGTNKFLNRICTPRSRSPAPASPVTTGKRASTDSYRSTRSEAATPRPRPQKRNSGTTMQVGRHANDWLFGGFSFTDAVRDLLRNDDNRN